MPFHPQVQRLQPLQQHPGIERADGRSEVAEQLRPGLQDVGNVHPAEGVEEPHPVVAGVGIGQLGELAVAPVEVALLDDRSANRCAMPADELGAGVNDDIGPVLEWLAEERRCHRVVDNERDARFVSDLGDRGEVGDVAARVADRLQIEAAGVGLDRLLEVLGAALIDERAVDPHLGKV